MPDNDMRLPGTLASPVRLNGHLTNATLQGMSAYEVAVANGFTGTEDEWLASLKGETGETPNIQVGNVSTGQPGTNASATMTGTKENPVLNITIPRGDVGATPNMTIGTVTTGEEGTQAQATITGTPENPVLNLTIPKGDTGDDGFNPVVEVTKDGNTATVSVTDATHTTEVNIVDGYTPQKNVDYFDGHSPKITGAKSQGTTFIYSDGEQIGAIADGQDGYTPRKGVDYFDGHTPAISGEKIDDTTFIYADGVRIATVLDGIDGNSPVITTVKSGKTTSILADSVVIGTVSDGADGHTPTITTTKSGKTTTIFADGTSIGTISDGQDGHSPEITTNKVGKVLSILSDGQIIGTVSDGSDGQDAVTPTITTDKSGTTTTIYSNGVAIGTVEDGADGTTPVITATKSEGITTIKANGVDIATINDGTSGEDGYSPTASVSKSSGVSTLTVTDESGTTSVQISDGTGMIASDPNNDGNIVLTSMVGVQVDTEPTQGSTNTISSGGVYNELTDVRSDLNDLQDEIDGGTIQKQEAVDVQILASRFVNAAGSNYGSTSSSSAWTYSVFVSCEKYSSIDITMPKVKNYTDAGIVFYSDNIGGNIPDNCVAGYICNYGTSGDPIREVRNFVIPEGAKYFRTTYKPSLSDFSCIGHWSEISGGLPEIRHDIEQLEEQLEDIPSIDDTLSIQGDAADAKAVGDEIQRLKGEIEGGIIERGENVNPPFVSGSIIIANSDDAYYGKPYSVSSVYAYSDFVNIEKYKKIEITMLKYVTESNAGIVFYSDNVASNIPTNCVAAYRCNYGTSGSVEYETRTFDIPAGAKYFRTTFRTNFEFSCIGYYDKSVGGLDEIYDTLDSHTERIESLEASQYSTGIAVKVTDFDDGVKTDDQIIADALAFASNYQQKTIIFDTRDWNISTAILLESNTTVYIDGVKIKQNDLTFDNVFRGKNFVVDPNYPNQFALSVSATENIRIIGLNNAIIEGPDVNATIYNPYQQQTVPMIGDAYGWRAFQIYICDCDGLEISGLKITKTRNWAISFEFCKNGHVHDIDFDTTGVKNGDGIDLRIGCHHFRIHDITGYTKDDTVACTALYPGYNNSKYPSQTSPSMYPCVASRTGESLENTDQRTLDIHDVVISNIFTGGAEHGVICLCNNGLQVYNVGINNVAEEQRSSRGAVIMVYTGYGSSWHSGRYSDNDLHNISVGAIESNGATYAFQCNCKVANVYVNKLVQNKSGAEKYSITNMDGITITNSGN